MKILFATRKGNPDWMEELITEVEERIPEATKWAEENDFDRIRIAEIDLTEKPDFVHAINWK
jgi:hypothetical protein